MSHIGVQGLDIPKLPIIGFHRSAQGRQTCLASAQLMSPRDAWRMQHPLCLEVTVVVTGAPLVAKAPIRYHVCDGRCKRNNNDGM